MKSESKPSFECKFCGHGYKKETTLLRHVCEGKRRDQQRNDQGVQMGFRAYQRFYDLSQSTGHKKTYEDFAASPYYSAFVKFGQYCVSVRCISFTQYLDWLLKNNKKLDRWCSDDLYTEWTLHWISRESVQDALERSLREMQALAEELPGLKNGFSDYFRYAPTNQVCYHITSARCSPWAVYCCESGQRFLETLNAEQLSLIMPWIDPDIWSQRLSSMPDDTAWARSILGAAGL